MPRKLKTFITTSGFFELAVAAPTKKSATEILGVRDSAFAQGFARQTEDGAIVAATEANPGIVLRRPVGSSGMFKEHAELPKLSALEKAAKRPPKTIERPAKKAKTKRTTTPAQNRRSAELYDLQERRREKERKREEAAREKERERRAAAVDRATEAHDNARERHDDRIGEFEKEREQLDAKIEAENERWDDEKEKLDAAIKRAEE